MVEHVEIEFKNLLTKREFDQLVDFFRFSKDDFIKQTNHYFDTSFFTLKENKVALRVREKNNTYELTLKQPAQIGVLETNEMISSDLWQLMKRTGELPEGHVKKAVQAILKKNDTPEHFGSLTTYRAEITYKGGLIALDESCYLNQTDYEIEYEVDDEIIGKIHFEELLTAQMITEKQTANKTVRFYRALKNKN